MALFIEVRCSSTGATHLLSSFYYIPWNEVHNPAVHSQLKLTLILTYRHVSGVGVTNKTGFGFYDGIYWTLYTTGYNSSQIADTLSSPSDWTLHWTALTSNWTVLHYSGVLPRTPPILLTVPTYNFLTRTSRKTSSSDVKNACLLVRYPAMDVLLLFRA
jgi:hypothetical protein